MDIDYGSFYSPAHGAEFFYRNKEICRWSSFTSSKSIDYQSISIDAASLVQPGRKNLFRIPVQRSCPFNIPLPSHETCIYSTFHVLFVPSWNVFIRSIQRRFPRISERTREL